MAPSPESYRDLVAFAESAFGGTDFELQPRCVLDLNLDATASRLVRLFEAVKELPRGKVLKDYPLTMLGLKKEEQELIAPKMALCVKRIPHKVLTADASKPLQVLAALKQRKVDMHRCLLLQVRDRPTEPLTEPLSEAMELFARQVLPEAEVASFGCYLAAMRLSASLARQAQALVLVDQRPLPPVALAMAAAAAGLFPPDVKRAQPAVTEEEGVPCFTQLLQCREQTARFAAADDLPALLRLEEMAWKEALRAPPEGLLKRLKASPCTNFVLEVEKEVVAVLYTQRIDAPQDVFAQRFQQVFLGHVNGGKTLQLIAINAHNKHKGLGTELRSFALHLARLDPSFESVCAVTLCMDYKQSGVRSLQQYVDQHLNHNVNDRILTFHTSYGAKVLGLVPKYRPEDVDNEGTGVLIQYKPKEWQYDPGRKRVKAVEGQKKKPKEPQIPALDILSGIMTDMGYEIDLENLDQGFFASGLDSFDMGVIQNRLGRALGRTLPATLMLDLPTVKELTEQLDKDRGLAQQPEVSDHTTSDSSDGEGRKRSPPERTVKGERRATTERASDDSITEWVRSWRQYLYEKTKAKRAEQRVRSGTPRARRSSSARRGSAFEKLSEEELERVQLKLTKLLTLPRNQRRLADVLEKHHENELGLFCDLRPVLDSISGPPLLAMGYVQDMRPRSLQDARDDMESRAQQLGGEAQSRQQSLLGLMKLDSLEPLRLRSASPEHFRR